MSKATNKLSIVTQIETTQLLLQKFDSWNVDLVRGLEVPTPRSKKKLRSKLTITEEALRGYGFLLECFKILHYDDFTADSEQRFDTNIAIITQLQKDRAFLRTIRLDHHDLLDNHLYQKKHRNNYPYHHKLQQYVEEKYNMLQSTGEVVLVGGYNGHHEIICFKQRRHGIHQITYNAGSEAIESPHHRDLVMGMCERQLVSSKKNCVKDHIRTLAEKLLRQQGHNATSYRNYTTLQSSLEKSLSNITASTEVSPQHKENCTTRSTREFLRHRLAPDQFKRMYDFVSKHSADSHRSQLCSHLKRLQLHAKQEQPNIPWQDRLNQELVSKRPPHNHLTHPQSKKHRVTDMAL